MEELLTEPLLVWRKWQARVSDGALRSLYKNVVWTPHQRMEAVCLHHTGPITVPSTRRCIEPPTSSCDCGFYGLWSDSDMGKYGSNWSGVACPVGKVQNVEVIGRCSIWGKIEHCPHGIRGQYAYPYYLVVVPPKVPYTALESDVEWLRSAEIAFNTARLVRSQYAVEVTVGEVERRSPGFMPSTPYGVPVPKLKSPEAQP